MRDLPKEFKHLGHFKGTKDHFWIEGPRFGAFLDRLKDLSYTHGLRGLLPNVGNGGTPYTFKDVPRAVIKDPIGELELLIEAYNGTDRGSALIKVYSGLPDRAAYFLTTSFAIDEFCLVTNQDFQTPDGFSSRARDIRTGEYCSR